MGDVCRSLGSVASNVLDPALVASAQLDDVAIGVADASLKRLTNKRRRPSSSNRVKTERE